jgi:hypothetical protein
MENMKLTKKLLGALLMKTDHQIKVVDLFFRENIGFHIITNTKIKDWFFSKPNLRYLEGQHYYRFRPMLLRHLISDYGDVFYFDFSKIITFYKTIVIDKKMVEKVKQAQKEYLEEEKLKDVE